MTVIEIAEKAGVSIGTVDRVLHNRGRVSAKTKERIQRIIDEEGYQPNPLARHLRRKENIRIGVLIPRHDSESGYWRLVWNGLKKAVSELSAFSFVLQAFEFTRPNEQSLKTAFRKMEEADCTAWILAPIMQDSCLALISASEVPRPFICIDSPLPGSSARSTIAQDPFRGGFLAGRLMSLLVPGGTVFGVIRPYTGAYNLNERSRGFMEWFSQNGNGTVVDIVCPEEEKQKEFFAVIDQVFDANPGLSGLFTVSSIVHKIADYLEKRNIKKSVALIGYDLVPENERYLKSGKIDCLISQRPEEQGRLAIQEIYKAFVLQEKKGTSVSVPLDVFFKENLP